MCLPMEATTEIVESNQWSRLNGIAKCRLQSSMVLMSDAPSESEFIFHSILGKSLQFIPQKWN
jgi:hypothetical protein